jgi:hypothetical protein
MTRPTIHGDGPARPATDAEIKAVLDQYTAADGAVDFHALWLDAQAKDRQDAIDYAVLRVNQLLQALADDTGDYAQRNATVDDFRTAVRHLRTLNSGHLPQLTARQEA